MLVSSARIRRYACPIVFAMVGFVLAESVAQPTLLPLLLAETCDTEAEETVEFDDLVDLVELSLTVPQCCSPCSYSHFYDEPVERLRSFSIGHLQRGPPCC